MALFCVTARADTPNCFSFVADPSVYYAPPGNITTILINGVEYAESWTNSFTVYTTYTNNCSEVISIGGSFGSGLDPMLAVYFADVPLTEFFDPSHYFALGESESFPFAWYVWSNDAPAGYTWMAGINAEACTADHGCSWVTTHFTAIVTPEPGTLLLFGTGLLAITARLRAAGNGRS